MKIRASHEDLAVCSAAEKDMLMLEEDYSFKRCGACPWMGSYKDGFIGHLCDGDY